MDFDTLLRVLRDQNSFGNPDDMIGRDLPSQGGIGGNMNGFPLAMNQFDPIKTEPFGGSQGFNPNIQKKFSAPDSNETDIASIINSMYTPEHTASDKLTEMLNQFPEREKPGIGRTILAMIAGVGTGNPEVGQQVIYAPYERKLRDFKEKFAPVKEAANLERYTNANERQLALGTASNLRGERNLKRQEDEGKERIRQGDEKIEIAKKRAEAIAFKESHPAWRFFETKGGNVTAVDPMHPEMKVDTGIPTGTLSDIDKINLGVEAELTKIGAREDETRETEGVRQGNRIGLEGVRQTNRLELKKTETPSTSKATGNETPAAKLRRLKNRTNQALLEHPEWKDYIKITPDGPQVKPTGRFSGPDTKTRAEILKYLQEETSNIRDIGKKTEGNNGQGIPPPIEKRTKGMKYTFPNGNIGQWDGTKWVPIKVVGK